MDGLVSEPALGCHLDPACAGGRTDAERVAAKRRWVSVSDAELDPDAAGPSALAPLHPDAPSNIRHSPGRLADTSVDQATERVIEASNVKSAA